MTKNNLNAIQKYFDKHYEFGKKCGLQDKTFELCIGNLIASSLMGNKYGIKINMNTRGYDCLNNEERNLLSKVSEKLNGIKKF